MITTSYIHVNTDPTANKHGVDITDITPDVEQEFSKSNLKNGAVTLFVIGSTAGITTIEYEPGLRYDFPAIWDKLVPRDISYRHDQTWGDANGYSHLRASILGPSLVVPFTNKKLALGTWQQIILVDFDNRPRSRQIMLQIIGE